MWGPGCSTWVASVWSGALGPLLPPTSQLLRAGPGRLPQGRWASQGTGREGPGFIPTWVWPGVRRPARALLPAHGPSELGGPAAAGATGMCATLPSQPGRLVTAPVMGLSPEPRPAPAHSDVLAEGR